MLTLTHTRMYTHTYECTQPYPYEPSKRLNQLILEIDEVTIGDLLSMGTSPTLKKWHRLNPKLKLEKYKYPCRVEDSNPGG